MKECREQRKKCLDEYNKMKRQLDKQHDLLNKVKLRIRRFLINLSF